MAPTRLTLSVLNGPGSLEPGLTELLPRLPAVRLLHQAKDPETFAAQHQNQAPDLVLVNLNGNAGVPRWLEDLIARFPKAEFLVCSQSRDPDFLIRIMKLRVGNFLPLPLRLEELQEVTARVLAEREKERAAGARGLLVAITGAKGGVGVTTVAVNLAVALAERREKSVVLVDLARPFPQVGQFLDLKSPYSLLDLAHTVDKLDPLFVEKTVVHHPAGLDVLLSSPDFDLDAPVFPTPQELVKVLDALRGLYSWVVADAGTWLDPYYLRLMQEADQVLMLTELTVPHLQNLRRLRGLHRAWELEPDKVKVVVNRYERDYTLGLKDLEKIFGQPAFATLPSDFPALVDAINQGEPLATVARRSRLWRRLKELAAQLEAACRPPVEDQSRRKGFFGRFFT
jgi:pilus assembly protein CpaE